MARKRFMVNGLHISAFRAKMSGPQSRQLHPWKAAPSPAACSQSRRPLSGGFEGRSHDPEIWSFGTVASQAAICRNIDVGAAPSTGVPGANSPTWRASNSSTRDSRNILIEGCIAHRVWEQRPVASGGRSPVIHITNAEQVLIRTTRLAQLPVTARPR